MAEDDDLNFKLIQIALVKTNANIMRAVNGEDVLKTVNEKHNIHAVLMDIQMPVLDGYETTKILKKHNPHIHVIAQTAFAMSDDKNKCMEAGCNDYISKPIEMEELYRKLGNCYERLRIKDFS
ncbi:MAG: response regulator [Bacteroidetes bacterium]|nr:response regulator [Bacteroidota bacterium]